jgi:hypothetical protein
MVEPAAAAAAAAVADEDSPLTLDEIYEERRKASSDSEVMRTMKTSRKFPADKKIDKKGEFNNCFVHLTEDCHHYCNDDCYKAMPSGSRKSVCKCFEDKVPHKIVCKLCLEDKSKPFSACWLGGSELTRNNNNEIVQGPNYKVHYKNHHETPSVSTAGRSQGSSSSSAGGGHGPIKDHLPPKNKNELDDCLPISIAHSLAIRRAMLHFLESLNIKNLGSFNTEVGKTPMSTILKKSKSCPRYGNHGTSAMESELYLQTEIFVDTVRSLILKNIRYVSLHSQFSIELLSFFSIALFLNIYSQLLTLFPSSPLFLSFFSFS